MNTFPHGIHPPGNKDITANSAISALPEPDTYYIPMQQHIGKPALPCVVKGDKVVAGQKIGEADGKISAHVFSSVSGEVADVIDMPTATGRCRHVVINSDGRGEETRLEPLADLSPASILRRITECGIVGQGGAGFPAAVKLSPAEKVDTFIINGAECEPYLTCDYRIMLECADKFLRGASYMAAALGLSEFCIGMEDNKPEAVEILQNAISSSKIKAKLVLCHTKYPQGAEKQLIYSVTKRKVKPGKLPSSVGVAVANVHTALSVYYAVAEGVKSYERIITVSGDGVKNPGNYRVKTGVTVRHILDACGGVGDDVSKLILGGPMMGFAQAHSEIAVSKTTSSILLLTQDSADDCVPQPCINCAKCAKACPMRLMPMYIDSYIRAADVNGAEKYGAMNCIECGSCAFVCPAHRPLVQSIRLAKKKIRERGNKA